MKKLHANPRPWAELLLHDAISNREDFTTSGALRGEHVNPGGYSTGILPTEYVDQLREDEPTYVVYSYATPIAWHGRRGWVVPDTRYSTTTSRHQAHCRHALVGQDYEQ